MCHYVPEGRHLLGGEAGAVDLTPPRESSQPPSLALICLAGLGSGVVLHPLGDGPRLRRVGGRGPVVLVPVVPVGGRIICTGEKVGGASRRGGPTPCFFGRVPPRRSQKCSGGAPDTLLLVPAGVKARVAVSVAADSAPPRCSRTSSRRSWCPVGAVGGAAGASTASAGGESPGGGVRAA